MIKHHFWGAASGLMCVPGLAISAEGRMPWTGSCDALERVVEVMVVLDQSLDLPDEDLALLIANLSDHDQVIVALSAYTLGQVERQHELIRTELSGLIEESRGNDSPLTHEHSLGVCFARIGLAMLDLQQAEKGQVVRSYQELLLADNQCVRLWAARVLTDINEFEGVEATLRSIAQSDHLLKDVARVMLAGEKPGSAFAPFEFLIVEGTISRRMQVAPCLGLRYLKAPRELSSWSGDCAMKISRVRCGRTSRSPTIAAQHLSKRCGLTNGIGREHYSPGTDHNGGVLGSVSYIKPDDGVGQRYRMVATAFPGYEFMTWAGGIPEAFPLGSPRATVDAISPDGISGRAKFLKKLRLNVQIVVIGGGTPAEAGNVLADEANRYYSRFSGRPHVQLEAISQPGYSFGRWSGKGIAYPDDGDDQPDLNKEIQLEGSSGAVWQNPIWIRMGLLGKSRTITAYFVKNACPDSERTYFFNRWFGPNSEFEVQVLPSTYMKN